VNDELLLDFLDDFVALDDRLLTRAPVLALVPFAEGESERALGPVAQALDHEEPRYAGEKTQACGEHENEDERPARETKGIRNPMAEHRAHDASRCERQRRFQAVQPHRFDAAARENQHEETRQDDGVGAPVAFGNILDASETPRDERAAQHDPPVCGKAEKIKHEIGDVGTDDAAGVAYRGHRDALRPARIASVIGRQHQYQVERDSDQRDPPRFTQESCDFRGQRVARYPGSAGFFSPQQSVRAS
jgi:hypothetical protein